MNSFPIVFQHDTMLCGVTCLQMVCEYYKRKYTGNYLSSLCHATAEGVSLLGLRETAVQLGLDCECGRISIDSMESLDMPCILHWNQNHFVVLYKVKKGKKFYVADPGMGVCRKMGDERTGADNHQVEQYVEMLRLQDDEHGDEQVERHEDVVDHSRADFVEHALAGIMGNSQQRHDGHPPEDNQLVECEMLVLEQRLEVGDAHEMVNKSIEAVGIDRPSYQEPIGRDDAQQRCPQHAPAEGHQLESHHQPQEGDEEEHLDEHQTGYSQA